MHKSLYDFLKENHFEYINIDLFSGPGGLCTGFKWAGIYSLIAIEMSETTVNTYALNHKADIFELEKYLKETDEKYLDSFLKETVIPLIIKGDINKVSNELLETFLDKRYGITKGEIDIVSGGAPCESFSIAGTRSEGDKRDHLFQNILRIAKAMESKAILFENVKGLLSKRRDGVKGQIFSDICSEFESKEVKPYYKLVSKNPKEIVLKATDYGVPQLRERLFLVAFREDLNNEIFNYPQNNSLFSKQDEYISINEAISDLPSVESGEEINNYSFPEEFISKKQELFLKLMRGQEVKGINPYLSNLHRNKNFNDNILTLHKGPNHRRKKLKLLSLIKEGESMKSTYKDLEENGKLEEVRDLFPKTIYGSRNRRLIKDKPSFTVTSHCLDEILHPTLNRAITPREAARLQSFPDWYNFSGPFVQFHGSDIQDKYEQIGDAIPPLLAYSLGLEIKKSLELQ